MKLSWEVDGIEIVVDKLEDGLEAGMEDAIEKILDNLERDAKDRIAVRPSIFTGQVYEGFDDQTTSAHSSSGISSRFINYSKHAGALEHGVHPSKYADGAPPIEALMPWVIAKLSDWNVETGGGGSSIKTPTAGDDDGDNPSNTIDDSTAEYQADWTRFHTNGYDEDELWNGQKVTFYDADLEEYRSGEISNINLRGDVYVTPDNGSGVISYDYVNGTPPNGGGIVVGEDWNSLSDSEKREISRDMLLNATNVDPDFSDSYAEKIRDVLNQYADNTKDPQESKRIAMAINVIRKDDSIKGRGSWSGDEMGGTLKLNTNSAKIDTIRHEIGHAYLSVKDYDYANGARNSLIEDWDSIKNWRDGNLGWKYDEIGPGDWRTQAGADLPHPVTYMLHNSDERDGLATYDDPNTDDFDSWEEHVRKATKYDLQTSTSGIHPDDPPDYDPFFTERQVLDPDGGRASPGDAIHFRGSLDDRSKEYHAKVESSVYKDSVDTWLIDVSVQGRKLSLPVDENGRFKTDRFDFLGFLPNGAKNSGGGGDTIDESDIPDDPGFYHGSDEVDERFKEAVNRHLWREMIATEVGGHDNRGEYYMRYDGYSATNAQETVAHLMSIIFSEQELDRSDASKLENLLDKSPELLYMASLKFEFSPEMVAVLETESGLSFDDLMYDIWREHIQ